MQLKALTAVFITAVLSAVVFMTAHASALSQTTTTAANGSTVTVVSGDSLWKIAEAYGTTYTRLFDANPQITDPSLIYPVEVLAIPAANEQLPDRMSSIASSTITESQADTSAPVEPEPTIPTPVTGTSTPVAQSTNSNIWVQLAQCESGDNWTIDTGNGYYGGLQFTLQSWQSVGGIGYPNQASEGEQILRAQALQSIQGWSAWPVCSVKLGL
ncbi:MAG: transglycosylase family protein [Candidatus Saccharimonadales bacterium]